VDVLTKNPLIDAKAELRQLYWHYAENRGVRDPGTYMRAAIMKALRPIVVADDEKMVVDAVCTYEFSAPAFTEEAALLRSTALVVLSDLDEEIAKYFATRLLADGYTEQMSGEPALTAVRVLAICGELLPLYYYATQQQGSSHPEVTAECLRSLGGAPEAVLDELVAQFGETDDFAALVGLFDLILQGSAVPRHLDFVTGFLRGAGDLDLYRYLVTVMATAADADVRRAFVETVQFERHPDKIEALIDALALAPNEPEMESLKEAFAMQERRQMRRKERGE
jgi:hypothetical protein